MATDKINISSLPETNVDWYADGERANAENLNRPIKDVSVIINSVIDDITALENGINLQTVDFDMNTHKIINVLDPTTEQDAATKKYVDDHAVANGGASLGANDFTGTQNLQDNILQRAKMLDTSETINALGDLGGGTDTINLELGNVITATVSTAAQTFTFTNPPASGSNGSFVLFLTNGGSQSVTWPGTVDWPGGTAPTLTAAGLDVLVFSTNNAGSSWAGFVAGLAVA